ncbi:TPA: hypothetical protein I8438_003093 [Serratia marcescens]|uniref:hypothetical protein n=1 Tax=Serratia TaxID=613 RepID=UPI0012B0ED48|nr:MULTISPECIES: hypothetical protein [Serratia]UBI62281.1 hypothetical protein GF111_15450 [Serratia sp. HRI]HAT2211183.1 hypothetical protein [Serratia marcescens]HAT2222499.1 hypothetical protein [Serratia marcescens]HAT2274869.1 hypothetical protein [Serratia marcescens]HAT2333042.1 hypothetical protein [Serratia marcescens]
MTDKRSLLEQVVAIGSQVKSDTQLAMIKELKDNGLLVTPTFNLAYGPLSFAAPQNKQ